MKIAVCDDDRNIVEKIKKDILEYDETYMVELYSSGESLLENTEIYDIIFLDIDMKGINGIETAKRIREKDKNVKIIYVTSYADYVNFAFSVHAFAYLLKPVTREKIHQQLREADSYYRKDTISQVLRFETKEGIIEKDVKEIYYFEYLNRYVHMKTTEKEYILSTGITEIANRMGKYGFVVPHKSFAVNLSHVKNVKGYDIYITDGSVLPLSQKKSTEFRRKLHEYLATLI